MPKKLLIVDDEASIRETLTRFFRSQGYEVRSASDGRQALGLILEDRPDMVITDMNMPVLDGFGLMRAAAESAPGLSVIMMTGVGEEEAAVRAKALGAVDYVSKPLDFAYLAASVKARLAPPP